ncbi:unnamed protein product [Didymodactylos carnosus]|uniref:NAD(P)(+)--arginine ADP-ribosyltransferase n=1 Tax=Didymodactylos carnosus TaxID=1234261 RepID=A0A8S2JZI4_9BILA|nr:unnamed protein product [Didymodactylos carnosus]CAF3831239.1 unnamed protein product [Didymodactylos carnosus]
MAITSILLHHPKFEPYSYTGVCYRGMRVKGSELAPYYAGQQIVNTTFLSTSKTTKVAEIFCGPNDMSVFSTYLIRDKRTALDISGISKVKDEEEVLILPFAAFTITAVEKTDNMETKIWLEECKLPETNNTSVPLSAFEQCEGKPEKQH